MFSDKGEIWKWRFSFNLQALTDGTTCGNGTLWTCTATCMWRAQPRKSGCKCPWHSASPNLGMCLTLGIRLSLAKLTSFKSRLNEGCVCSRVLTRELVQSHPSPAHRVHTELEAGFVPVLWNREIFCFQWSGCYHRCKHKQQTEGKKRLHLSHKNRTEKRLLETFEQLVQK